MGKASGKNAPKRIFYIISFFVFGFLAPRNSQAQGYYFWNPANKNLPYVSEINPAIITKQFTQIAAGVRLYHVGFLSENSFAMKESRVNLSFPFLLPTSLGMGFDMRYFDSGLFSELNAAFMLSREIAPKLSLGVKLGFEQRGFNTGEFVGFDLNDPLIANGTSFLRLNAGAGMYWSPGNVELGVGVDHLNAANVNILGATTANLPREITGALGYRLGAFTPTLLVHHDGVQSRIGFSITAAKNKLGSIRLGYEENLPIRVEATFNFTRNDRLQYGVDVPHGGTRGLTAGTQALDYIHILGRAPELGQPEILFSTNETKVIEKKIIRSVESGLSVKNIAEFDEVLPAYVSTARHRDPLLIIVAGALSAYETDAIRARRYRDLHAQVSSLLQQNPGIKVVVRTTRENVADAKAIAAYMVRQARVDPSQIKIAGMGAAAGKNLRGFAPGRTTVQRLKPALSEASVVINLRVPGKTRKTKGWTLRIANADGETVKTFSGGGNLPATLNWDWRNDGGALVAPGKYAVTLEAKTIYDNKRTAEATPLGVILVKRTVNLKFHKNKATTQTTPIETARRGEGVE